MNDQQIEKEVQAKGLTAPRVRLADIEDAIKSIDIVKHVSASGQVLRWAVLNMRNGFAITGRPSCSVSPENDNDELGKKIATDNAISEAWALLGYELKSRLAGPTPEQVSRFLTWPVPPHVYPDGAPGQPGRTGTNLLDAPTAQEMLTHVLRG
jgi:hypothetical protein